ncbi:MAG: hypothetical protein ACYC1E_05615 [Propionibacteriaceae bacterium]
MPVLLGAGTPLLAAGVTTTRLSLLDSHPYPSSMVGLAYQVVR